MASNHENNRFNSCRVYHFNKYSILITTMKHKHKKTLHELVESIIRTHLSVEVLPTSPIKTAVVEAIKVGERLGYDKGYNDAKAGCGKDTCDCEHSLTI